MKGTREKANLRHVSVMRWTLGLLMAGLASGSLFAQLTIEQRQPVGPDVEISVENAFGSIEIEGWDRQEVLVSGTLAAGIDDFDVDADDDGLEVVVSVPDAWLYASDDDTVYRSVLKLRVPRTATIQVQSLNASVTIGEIDGTVSVESVNGTIAVQGNPPYVEIETMTGSVEVEAQSALMEVEAISAPVVLRGAARAAEVTTVSGDISISGRDFEQLEVETTAGNVLVEGSLAASGGIGIETFSGRVELRLPPSSKAHFELLTFTGAIESDLGPPTDSTGKFAPYRRVRFTTGLDEFEIDVQTYSGDISVRTTGR